MSGRTPRRWSWAWLNGWRVYLQGQFIWARSTARHRQQLARQTRHYHWQAFTLWWRLHLADLRMRFADLGGRLRWLAFRACSLVSERLIDLAWQTSATAARLLEDEDTRITAAIWPETQQYQGEHTRQHPTRERQAPVSAPETPVSVPWQTRPPAPPTSAVVETPPPAFGRPTPPSWPLTAVQPPLPEYDPIATAFPLAPAGSVNSADPAPLSLPRPARIPSVSVVDVAHAAGFDINPPDIDVAVAFLAQQAGAMLRISEHRPLHWRSELAERIADMALCLPTDVDDALRQHLFHPLPPLPADEDIHVIPPWGSNDNDDDDDNLEAVS